mgnify:CR=1 FL=1
MNRFFSNLRNIECLAELSQSELRLVTGGANEEGSGVNEEGSGLNGHSK